MFVAPPKTATDVKDMKKEAKMLNKDDLKALIDNVGRTQARVYAALIKEEGSPNRKELRLGKEILNENNR